MSRVAEGQAELLRALVRHRVDFVVIGGVAAQVHGWQSATLDLDISVSREDTNVDRFNAARDDILRSKEAAGRDKDLEALPQMRRDFGGADSS